MRNGPLACLISKCLRFFSLFVCFVPKVHLGNGQLNVYSEPPTDLFRLLAFRSILRTEGVTDVFQTRRWFPASESSEEEMLEDDTDSSTDDDWMAR